MAQQYYYSSLTGPQLDQALSQVSQLEANAAAAAASAQAAAQSAQEAKEAASYQLPIGGETLGGVKNGGNVTINADGTMTAPESGGIDVTGASAGQTVQIAAVDEVGVPTAWLPVDLPQGGAESWENIQTVTVEKPVAKIIFSDLFAFKKLMWFVGVYKSGTSDVQITLNTEQGMVISGNDRLVADFPFEKEGYQKGWGQVYTNTLGLTQSDFHIGTIQMGIEYNAQDPFGGAVKMNGYSRILSGYADQMPCERLIISSMSGTIDSGVIALYGVRE